VCGCSRESAQARRQLLGLPSLMDHAAACSPECGREHERRRMRANYGPGSSYRVPGIPKGWRCQLCGCSAEEAHKKRLRSGLSPLDPRVRTCTPECRRRAKARGE
jgi:hypothetical protein